MASTDAIPPPPREPSPRARALIFRFQAAQNVLLLLGLIFAGAGALFCIPFCWGLPADAVLSLEGRRQQGLVLSATLDRSVTINGVHPTEIRFSYGAGGERYTASSSTLDRAVIEAAGAPEALVPIEVSRLRPSWARVAGTTRSIFGWGGALSLLFPIAGGVLVVFGARSRARRIRVFTEGEPAVATVVSAAFDRSTTINGRHPYKLIWEFRVGTLDYDGSFSAMDAAALEALPRDGQVVVLYDKDDPSVNTLWVE